LSNPNIRKYAYRYETLGFGAIAMAQAKTLTVRELRKVLDQLPVNKYRSRNRLMLLMTHWSGMRVGEVAALSIADVRNADGTVKNEIRLDATQTKGKHARTVFVNDRLRKEVASYLKAIVTSDPSKPVFTTQKRQALQSRILRSALTRLDRIARSRQGYELTHRSWRKSTL
jgi:integrase/recombinase XerD